MTLPPSTIVTVGSGTSALVDELLARGHRVIAVDVSATALDQLRARIGPVERLVTLVGDVRTLRLGEPVDAWHDRAVFHFLVSEVDQRAYVASAVAAVRPGGHLVLAGFAPGGPAECSGLPVARHEPAALIGLFAPEFEVIESFEADHVTPWGSHQRFLHTVFRRRAAPG